MRHMKAIGMALLALFAMGVVAAASASAKGLPAITTGTCEKHTGVKKYWFTNSTCTTESATKEGEYEWSEATNKSVTTKSKSTVEPKLETANGSIVVCKSDTSTGTAKGTKNIEKVAVTFTGCKAKIGSITETCHSTNPAGGTGEIITKELEGEIGYIEPKANKEVGEDLWPSARTASEKTSHTFEKPFAEFECGFFVKNVVKGSVEGKLTISGKSTKGELVYAKGTNPGEQKIQKLENVEGGVKDVLMSELNSSGSFEEANEQTEQEVTFGEAVELKA